MNKTKELLRTNNFKKRLLVSGVLLSLCWSIILGVSELLVTLPCFLTPDSCSESSGVSTLLLFSPIVAGSIMIPIGFLYNLDISRFLKFLIVTLCSASIVGVCYYAVTLIGISVHGLG